MNKILILLLSMLLAAGAAASAAQNPPLESGTDRFSYALGQQLGRDLKMGEVAVTPELIAAGVRDALAGTSRMSDEEMELAMEEMQREMMMKHLAQQERMGRENLEKGQAFLAENAKRQGVETTPSGLQYRITEEGTGKTPGPDSSVTVHYRGTLIDGTVFDSSFERGEPVTFPVSGVIPGWTEALQLMKEGAKWTIYLPADLAYGEHGAGQVIGPNETLIFDVELISVN
ncbi:FKBP-type peptidyl-prolyl cis-trans isomerase [Geoalkalibacter halelectricus]|uniref:Peptidyl-prolyl cis-trans isomerase n=1 Tax=Geoalkalibacter halelectricus TaxID=2847045 RepID=A0ABY5ZNY0_9BACT|nr:FKBP-type peptidyl-prolyl cis-trans isomerase [Geoalkalibacter halelectricus]MDO3377383.1 FKBP-type peptidyl-prolyl cis-trans isomerase [Geoalkalibacter halelectricus]UWZ80852.1 FKBP-type peptidyl-prolyl cis-trans isomerase [Geoalkalibacter halelectricus]